MTGEAFTDENANHPPMERNYIATVKIPIHQNRDVIERAHDVVNELVAEIERLRATVTQVRKVFDNAKAIYNYGALIRSDVGAYAMTEELGKALGINDTEEDVILMTNCRIEGGV